jgi:hypothetical protein
MLRRLSGPLPLSEASLLVCRPALNAPVLNEDYLPVGPARAAVVLFAEEYGGIGLAFGIRSIEGGQVAVFRNPESIDDGVPLAEALEPALAAAERMGFLFDEDLIGSSGVGRSDALALWVDLMGELVPEEPEAESGEVSPADSQVLSPQPTDPVEEAVGVDETEVDALPELVLEEVAPLEVDPPGGPAEEIDLELEAPVEDVSQPTAPVEAPTPGLSKFRHLEGDPGATASARPAVTTDAGRSGSALGRIALKRVRRGRHESRRMSALTRLLSSF